MHLGLVWLSVALATVMPALAIPIVNLGTATSFGLLGGTISNTGTSIITGNVGVKDGGTITGFNPTGTTVGGSVIAPGSTSSNNAYMDFINAFDAATLLTSTQSYADLTVNRTFIGNNVYTFTLTDIAASSGINLTFDAQDDPNQVFVIRMDGAFTVDGALTFTLQNQARASNIFWIIGTAGTIGVGNTSPITFEGNILAGTSFTMAAAAGGSGVLAGTINGCVFSQTANTLAGTTNVNGCGGSDVGGGAGVPEPGSAALVGLGFAMGALAWRKRRVSPSESFQ